MTGRGVDGLRAHWSREDLDPSVRPSPWLHVECLLEGDGHEDTQVPAGDELGSGGDDGASVSLP
jgi:hypothetical protein